LIKDILESKPFYDIITKAQTIVTTFYRAKKQYAILQTKQEKPMAFVLSVITRWGTQYGLVKSVLKNKLALFAWVNDKNAQVGKKKPGNTLKPLIQDHEFWQGLTELSDILKPIHEAQKMSESNGATLAKVIPRWLQLEQELQELSQIYPYLKPTLAPSGVFNERLNKQTLPIHWVAYLLDPISSLRHINSEGKESAKEWIIQHAGDKKKVNASIQDFLGRENGFSKHNISHLHLDDPVRYWKCYLGSRDHNELAHLAVRMFKTIANSVASERAFSAMGLIVTKLRNRLGPDKANKLIYIYMNQRVLDRAGDLLLGDWVEKSDDQQVDLEDLLLSFEEEDGDQDDDDDIELDIERLEA
jgi:hypothetical protein